MLRDVLIIAVPLLLVLGIVGYFAWAAWSEVEEPNVALLIGYTVVTPTKLDEGFTDANGDLIADAPADPAKLLDPETLVFSTLNDPEKDQKEWADFTAHLGKVTGKKVEHVQRQFTNNEEIAELKEGKVHVLAANTGVVSTLVNRAGFVPLCVMADKDGKFGYQIKFIVPSDSPGQSLKDFKGKRLAAGSLNSNSSFKAPVMIFWNELHAVPDFFNAGGQERCIAGVATKEPQFDIAAVAGDFFERKLADGHAAGKEIKKEQIRELPYNSPTYPPQCFGTVYNLKPELAAKVREAFLNFNWSGTSLEKAYQAAHQVKFVPVDYKKDWEPVRKVDEALNKMVEEARAKKGVKKGS
jgi:phosphonate transport system substrate-binding protein